MQNYINFLTVIYDITVINITNIDINSFRVELYTGKFHNK